MMNKHVLVLERSEQVRTARVAHCFLRVMLTFGLPIVDNGDASISTPKSPGSKSILPECH